VVADRARAMPRCRPYRERVRGGNRHRITGRRQAAES
jgi:hypothetical protein